MKNLKFLILPAVLVMLASGNLFASHYDFITNLSAEFTTSPTRMAVTDSADAAYYNPAGTVFMKDGLYLNASNMTILNYYDVKVKDGYSGQTHFKQGKPSPVVPNAYIVYKQDDWAAFLAVNTLCGGGSLYWANGLPSANESIRAMAFQNGFGSLSSEIVTAVGNPDTDLNGSVNIGVSSVGFGTTIGASYKLYENVSVSLGIREIHMMKTAKVDFAQAGTTGFKATLMDIEWNADGFTGVIGAHFRVNKKLNVGLNLEGPAYLEYKVDVKKDASSGSGLTKGMGFPDGGKFRYDLPAKFNVGAEYKITEDFKIMASGIYFLSNWTKYEKLDKNGNRVKLDGTHSYEISAGFEWQFVKNFAWSAGIDWNFINQTDEIANELLYKNDAVIICTGFTAYVNDDTKLIVGFMRNVYPDMDIKDKTLGVSSSGKRYYDTTYQKKAYTVAVGLQYRFL